MHGNVEALLTWVGPSFPSLSSLLVLGATKPIEVDVEGARDASASSPSLAPRLTTLTIGGSLTDPFRDHSDTKEYLPLLPPSFLPRCTSLRHLTLAPPFSSRLDLVAHALPSTITLEAISVSYAGIPTAAQKRNFATLVSRGRDPRERVETNERLGEEESVVWTGVEEGKRFFDEAGAPVSWEEVLTP